ncbi:hypothetical protein GGR50DRAFT_691439 [Xylaria sp. CBS 124048]|nr:hypothetical protein GGR50DRAFT_691439 [Xylaria sp. CBS 124048]
MQLCLFLQTVLITGALSAARREPRQVVITVTAGVPFSAPTASSPGPVPWEPTPPAGGSASIPFASPASASGAFSLPPLPAVPGTATVLPGSASSGSSSSGSSSSGGARCDKGYTYCGFTLTNSGHNFPSEDIDNSYCEGLPELCSSSGKRKTDVGQAVFVCMSDQPSSVELLCACSGTCLNNASSNYIAHCDTPCVNG